MSHESPPLPTSGGSGDSSLITHYSTLVADLLRESPLSWLLIAIPLSVLAWLAAASATMLLLAVTALVMPAVFNLAVFGRLQESNAALNQLSLLVAIVLLATYVLSLVFSLITHRSLLISLADNPAEPNLSLRAA